MDTKNEQIDFLSFWFDGFSRSLDFLPESSKIEIFKFCGRSCSDSYTRQIYADEYAKATDLYDFLVRLKYRFPEIEFERIDENTFILIYRHCACDLVVNNHVINPSMCECSRQSLLYNWESVLNGQPFEIKLIQSILNGSDCCMFEINIDF